EDDGDHEREKAPSHICHVALVGRPAPQLRVFRSPRKAWWPRRVKLLAHEFEGDVDGRARAGGGKLPILYLVFDALGHDGIVAGRRCARHAAIRRHVGRHGHVDARLLVRAAAFPARTLHADAVNGDDALDARLIETTARTTTRSRVRTDVGSTRPRHEITEV